MSFIFSFVIYSGAVRGEVDLLPPPSPAANWTAALPTLPSSDSSLVFSFNGSNHVAAVPDSIVSTLSGDHFTLQLWMRRGGANIQASTTQSRGNRKDEETIVCSTVKNGAFHLWNFTDTDLHSLMGYFSDFMLLLMTVNSYSNLQVKPRPKKKPDFTFNKYQAVLKGT